MSDVRMGSSILITGADSSLGQILVETSPFKIIYVICMEDMRKGKKNIERFIPDNVDYVINNHGWNHLSWIGNTPEEDGEKMFSENVLSAYWVVNKLRYNGATCDVINVASATYRVPQRCTSLYCASKAALVQMTKVMARELSPIGWRVNAIAPGLMKDTNMAGLISDQLKELRGWSEVEQEKYAKSLLPMNRATTTTEVSSAIWKMFELPRYVNGICLDMMGGV